jgi:hypothetical protein
MTHQSEEGTEKPGSFHELLLKFIVDTSPFCFRVSLRLEGSRVFGLVSDGSVKGALCFEEELLRELSGWNEFYYVMTVEGKREGFEASLTVSME